MNKKIDKKIDEKIEKKILERYKDKHLWLIRLNKEIKKEWK